MKTKPNVANLIYKRPDGLLVTNTDLLADQMKMSAKEMGDLVWEQLWELIDNKTLVAQRDFFQPFSATCIEINAEAFRLCFESRGGALRWKEAYQKIISEFDRECRRRRAAGETVTLNLGNL